jgi:hypothetical protein
MTSHQITFHRAARIVIGARYLIRRKCRLRCDSIRADVAAVFGQQVLRMQKLATVADDAIIVRQPANNAFQDVARYLSKVGHAIVGSVFSEHGCFLA